MARTQSPQYPEVRNRILDAAAKLFAKKGFATTTIMDLSVACEVSRGALYHYFKSKELLLSEILAGHVKHMLSALESIAAKKDSPEATFRALCVEIMEINAGSADRQVVLLNDANLLEPKVLKVVVKNQKKIVSIMRDALIRLDKTGRITPDSGNAHVMMLLGMLNYTFSWYSPSGPMPPREFANQTVDVFLNGFLAKK